MNNIKISKNFKLKEFQSSDTKTVKLDSKLLERLQLLREYIEKPIHITSGYRTPEHNKKVNGHPKSRHMKGKAADIRVYGLTVTFLQGICKIYDFDKVIPYHDKDFIHLQVK